MGRTLLVAAAVFAAVALGHAGAARGDTIEACGYGIATAPGAATCLSLPDALAQADATRGDDTIRLQPGSYCPIAVDGRFDRLELVGEGIGGLAFPDDTPVAIEGFEAGLSTFRYSPVYCGSDYPDALVAFSDDAGRVTLRNLTVDGAPNGGISGPSDGIAIARTEATLVDVVVRNATRDGVSYTGGSFGFDDFEMDESALLDNDTGLDFAGEGSLVGSTVSGGTDGVVARGDFHLIHDTIAGNAVGVSAPCCASTMQVTYSIVAGNSVNDCGLTADWENASFNGYNLLGPGCPREAATDILAAETTLASPDLNGGPTPSIVPPPDAEDVVGVLCPAVDQREFRVDSGAVCDIGSIEVGASGTQAASVPESFDFGQVDSGSTATRTVGLGTAGGDQLDVFGVSISGDGFSIASDDCTHAVLIPGHNLNSCGVAVSAAPAADGPLTGTLTFEDTAGTQTVALTARGVTRPVGAPDSYDVDGAPIEVAAPGVLANDAAGTTVEKVVAEPSDGTLTGPAADGSFRYAPDPGFLGDDSFSYVAVDGAGVESEPIDVTLHVLTSAPGADLYVDASWSGLEPGVDPDGDGPATSFGEDAFATLSDALEAAGTAAVVHVAAGDYAEGQPTIDEQAVHVVGAGAATTHLTLEGGLLVDAPNAVVEGLDVRGLGSWDAETRTFSGSSASSAIAISRYGFGATIRDCVVGDAYTGVLAQGFGGESELFGLRPDADDVEDVEVEHVVDGIVFEGVAGGRIAGNHVHDTGDAFGGGPQAAILVGDPDEVGPLFGNEITGNTIERSGNHGISVRTRGNAIEDNTVSDSGTVYPAFKEPSGIEVAADGTTVSGNTISGSAFAGVKVDGADTTIDGNTIAGTANGGADGGRAGGAGSGGAAILLATDGGPGTAITNNTLGGNSGWAILQTDSGGGSSSTVAGGNDLSGNGLGGVENRDAATTLDATGNWWGDASGPSGAGPGTGASVSEHVLYDPWLDCAPGETCAAPVAAFSATPSAIPGSLAVDVDGSASTGAESYAWDFGDGSSGTGATASHTYASAGTYTIALTVGDGGGRTATVSHAVTVPATAPNLAPTASFVATPSAEPGSLEVTVDGSASGDEDGSVAGYAWDFGDGGSATGVTASHTYLAAGTFEIALTVTDDAGATATVSHSVTVPASTEPPEPVDFASPETFATGTQPWYVAAADLDGDGDLDLVAPNLHSGNVSVLLGDGTGGYADQTTFPAGKNPGAVAVGDLNGDGAPDLAVTDGGNGTLSALLGDGDGGFGDASTFTAGAPDVFNQGVAMVDLDGDHDLDVAVANGGSSSLTILSGDGSGGLTPSPPIEVGSHPELLTATELDGDTLADLAVAVSGENSVAVVAGGSDGDPPKLYPVGANPGDVAAGDLNGDGALDLAVTNYDDSTVSVLLGDGEGGFGEQTAFATGTQPESVAIGDLNLDGKQDLAISNGGGNSVSVLLGDGAGGFAPHVDTPAGGAPLSLALADLDGNGALDIAVADASDDTITVLLNESRPLPPRNEAPAASFTATPSAEPGSLEVAVDASASTDADGSIARYAWDFGDGSNGDGATATHTYADAGTYTVTLTVTDDDGATASVSHDVTVPATPSNAAPTASFVATPAPGSLDAAFDASASSDTDGSIASDAWDFGDGGTGTGATASHTYESAGTYTVTLTVTDDGGATAGVSHDVTVPATAANRPPAASFTSSTSGLEVSLDASGSSDPDGSIASYAWDFGDGSTGDGETASHAYEAAGTYTVRLTVTDDGGATATVEHDVTVAAAEENGAPQASFTATPSDEAGSLEVAVDASGSSDSDGSIASYAWDFGDGSSASGKTASHAYDAAGTYTIALTVTDDGGATATASHDVTVPATAESESPVASFEAEPSEEPGSFEVAFDASDSTGSIVSYAWDLGDGVSGSGATTSHTYDRAGTYTVTLTVTGEGGATATVSHDVRVPANAKPQEPAHPKPPAPRQPVVLPPSASFSVAPAGGDTTVTWTFDASSSSRATSFAWDFGDGGSASGATAGHVFARPGTYTVRLTARGAGGSASVEHSVTVAPRPPRAAFAYLPARPVPGRPMGFIADTVPVAGGAPLASYAWDFGDGTTASGPREGHVYLSSGSFRVTLTVTDTAGQTATAAMAVAVAAADAPSAMFVYEPAPVGAGADTTFAGVAIRRAGTWAATKLVGWSWSFGDGTTASGQQAHHVFARPGSYRVQLTVTDASGAAGTVASTVVVKTNVVAVDETVSVADTDTAALPPSIAVLEPIVVSDAPGLVPPASLDVTESVGVSDVPGIVPPAVVVDDESWGFTDSTVTAVHH